MTDRPDLIELANATREAVRGGVHMLRLLDESSELTTSQLATLNSLREGPIAMSLLAQLKGVAQPTMSQHISRLQHWGHVKRTTAPDDGRFVLVELTPQGREITDLTNAQRNKGVAEFLEVLTPEQQDALAKGLPVLNELSRKLVEARNNKGHSPGRSY